MALQISLNLDHGNIWARVEIVYLQYLIYYLCGKSAIITEIKNYFCTENYTRVSFKAKATTVFDICFLDQLTEIIEL